MFLPLVILGLARIAYCFEDNDSVLHRYIIAFGREIECMREFGDFDEDIMLSVAMTVGQLNVIEHNLSKNGVYNKNISHYRQIADDILEKIEFSNHVEQSSFTKIANPRLWEMNRTLSSIVYDGIKQPESGFLPDKSHKYFDEKSRKRSHECIELLMEDCKVSDDCLKEQTKSTFGFNTIEQVLYWQVYKQHGCESIDRRLNADLQIHKKCLKLFLENSYFLLENKLPDHLHSFFLDSVGRCGIETALEFLFPEYKERVLDVITSVKCSCGNLSGASDLEKEKAIECSNHFRAVRLSTLAVQLRDLMNFSNF